MVVRMNKIERYRCIIIFFPIVKCDKCDKEYLVKDYYSSDKYSWLYSNPIINRGVNMKFKETVSKQQKLDFWYECLRCGHTQAIEKASRHLVCEECGSQHLAFFVA